MRFWVVVAACYKKNQVADLYGQEMNQTTYNLVRMNMILHGVHFRQFDRVIAKSGVWSMQRQRHQAASRQRISSLPQLRLERLEQCLRAPRLRQSVAVFPDRLLIRNVAVVPQSHEVLEGTAIQQLKLQLTVAQLIVHPQQQNPKHDHHVPRRATSRDGFAALPERPKISCSSGGTSPSPLPHAISTGRQIPPVPHPDIPVQTGSIRSSRSAPPKKSGQDNRTKARMFP